MKKSAYGCLYFCIAAACFGQGQEALCPKHIETPDYPEIARTAHITGKITLAVTIDAIGNVTHVEATADNPSLQAHPLLQKYAAENMRRWTFAKPPSTPHMQVIVYDYEIDPTLPASGGPSSMPSITKVKFDLPGSVTILTNARIIDED